VEKVEILKEMINFTPLLLSFKLAFITTLILFIIATPLAWWLSRTTNKIKPILEAISALPIVLPPTVIGFYLLIAFSKNSPLGSFLYKNFNIELLFTFSGLIIASIFYSFPFMLQPLQSAFESLNKNMIEASFLCKKNSLQTLIFVALPNIKPSILSALVVTFAHTIGEFGVVLMVGGQLEETKVASIAIYEMVENLDYKNAHIYSAILVAFSFFTLLLVYFLKRKDGKN